MLKKIACIFIDLALLATLAFGFKTAIEFRSSVLQLLFFHQEITLSGKILIVLPSVLFYSGLVLWFFAVSKPFTSKGVINRILASFFIAALLLTDIFWSATFTIGGGQSLFSIYYLLTQTDVLHFSFGLFKILFFVSISGTVLITSALSLYRLWQQKALARSGVLITALLLIFLSFIPFSHETGSNVSLNSVIYLLSSTSQTPEKDDFFRKNIIQDAHSPIPDMIKKPNIVLIIMESTRKDSLSFYNEHLDRPTTFFDELAKNGIVFNNVYAISPLTIKAMVAINCATAPYLNYPILESHYGIPGSCLAQELKAHGYQTMFMQGSTANYGNKYSLTQTMGFSSFYAAEDFDTTNFKHVIFTGYDDRAMLPSNKEWLANTQEPFFASYLTVGPHWPFTLFDETEEIRYIQPYNDNIPPAYQRGFNNYLNAVHYQDRFFAKLFDQYKEAGKLDNTIFIFVADHGSGFGEHLFSQRLNNMYQEIVNVPLLIYAPGLINHPQINNDLLSQSDIAAMLKNLLSGNDIMTGIHNHAVFSACWYWNRCLARTDLNYKFIHNFGHSPDELYDLNKDPLEKHNIITQHTEMAEAFRQEAFQWYYRQLAIYAKLYHPQDNEFYLRGHLRESAPYP